MKVIAPTAPEIAQSERLIAEDFSPPGDRYSIAAGAHCEVPDSFAGHEFLLTIPDELLEYYAWLFSQSGLAILRITFEHFLAVIAALWPSRLHGDLTV